MTRHIEMYRSGCFYFEAGNTRIGVVRLSICFGFVQSMLGDIPEKISVTASTRPLADANRMKLAMQRVGVLPLEIICFGNSYEGLTRIEQELADMGIMPGDTFWLRVKPIPAAQAVSAPTPA